MDKQQNQGVGHTTDRLPAHRPEFFVVIGNGRTGSTWLQTTLDQLPDVRARLELKLRLSYQDPHPMHVYVDRSTRSIKDCILQSCAAESIESGNRPIFGSKLIFDPYGYLDPEDFDFLGEILGNDIPILFLKRNYAAQFFSWKVRGVFHRLNPEAIARLDDFDRTLVETIARHWQNQVEPRLQRIVLTLRGKPLASAPPSGEGKQVIRYPLEDAIEDLLVLFYNDLKTVSLAQRSRRYLMVDYDEIESRLPEIVRFLGSGASEIAVRTALGQPVTARLQALDSGFVQPAGILELFSECLQQALNLAARDISPDQIWRWRKERKWIELEVPGLAALLNRHGLRSSRFGGLVEGTFSDSVLWRRRRPVYALE